MDMWAQSEGTAFFFSPGGGVGWGGGVKVSLCFPGFLGDSDEIQA